MVAAQGGPTGFVEQAACSLPQADVVLEATAPQAGYVSAIDGEALGLAVVGLGGGRRVETDQINPAVGLCDVVALGRWVERGDLLAQVHAARSGHAERAVQQVRQAVHLSETAPKPAPLVYDLVVQ
jgi:thymidine phosphorylase